jgi:hypothetical protein
MQYGKAVVGCDTGGVPEVVENGRDGLLVPPGDRDALASALTELMADDALRERMGTNGRERVLTHQHAMTMAATLEQVYETTIGDLSAARRTRRLQEWGSPVVSRFDGWTELPSSDGQPLREGRPGAVVEMDIPSGSDLILTLRTDTRGATLLIEQDALIGRIHTAGERSELIEHRVAFPDARGGPARLRVLDSHLDPADARVLLQSVVTVPAVRATLGE